MLTKWVKQTSGIRYGVDGETIPGIPNSSPVNVGVIAAKDVGGTERYVNAWAYDKGYGFRAEAMSASSSDGIYVGSGTTPATEDDYTMESVITSGLTGSTTRLYVYNSDDNTISVRYVVTLTNTGSSNITIAEIGKVGKCPTSSAIGSALSSSSANKIAMLLDHTILDSPITLEPNASCVIQYDFVVYAPVVEP